jgi:phosphoribosylglycinamide formyltransferase
VVREIQCKTPETLEELTERMVSPKANERHSQNFKADQKQHEQEHELIVEGTQLAIIRLWEERAKRG